MASTGAYVPAHRHEAATGSRAVMASTYMMPNPRPFSAATTGRTLQVQTYGDTQIHERLGGGHHHTFVRATPPLLVAEHYPSPNREPSIADRHWDQAISRIMVTPEAHLNAPEELWTRHSFELLESNRNNRIPLFSKQGKWVYMGRYEIVRWEMLMGGSEEIRQFVMARKRKQVKPWTSWEKALNDDWVRVELRRCDDQSLGNPMEM